MDQQTETFKYYTTKDLLEYNLNANWLKVSGIYEIKNVENGKIYIGSSTSILTRWLEHVNALRGGRHRNSKLQNAWNKYLEESFIFRIIELSDREQVRDREQYYLDTLLPKYNIRKLVCDTRKSATTEETREKRSQKMLGRKMSAVSQQHRKQTRLQKGTHYRGKTVYQIDPTTLKVIAEYESIRRAAHATGIDRAHIGYAIKDPDTRSSGGYLWSTKLKQYTSRVVDRQKTSVEIYQLDPDTLNIVEKHASYADAESKVGITRARLRTACRTGCRAGNHLWVLVSEYETKIWNKSWWNYQSLIYKIEQRDATTQEVLNTYDSYTEASRLSGMSRKRITTACEKGKLIENTSWVAYRK